jgi:hypothetical protein
MHNLHEPNEPGHEDRREGVGKKEREGGAVHGPRFVEMLRMVSARSGSRRVWCFAIHIKPGGVSGRRFKEQHCVRFGAVKCARIEESHAVDALVAGFVGVTV